MFLFQIIIKSLKFDKQIYLEAKNTQGFIRYSILIVLLVSLCTGIGTINLTNDSSIIRDLLSSLVGWLIWTSIVYVICVRLLNYSSTFTQLARTLGVAYSPGVLNIFGIIQVISLPLLAITSIWTIISFIFALKHALEISAEKAFLISLLSFIPYIFFRSLLFLL